MLKWLLISGLIYLSHTNWVIYSQTKLQQVWTAPDFDALNYVNTVSKNDGIFLRAFGKTSSWGIGGTEGVILDFEPTGKLIKSVTIGERGNDEFKGAIGKNVWGNTNSWRKNDRDGWLIEINDSGYPVRSFRIGNSSEEIFCGASENSYGQLAFCGVRFTFERGNDVWVTAIDTNKQLIFSTIIGGDYIDSAFCIVPLLDGWLVGGKTQSFRNADFDGYLLSLDNKGELRWTLTLGTDGANEIRAIAPMQNGNYLVLVNSYNATNTANKLVICIVSAAGELSSAEAIDLNKKLVSTAINILNDNSFLVVGKTDAVRTGTDYGFCLKLTAQGKFEWLNAYGGPFPQTLEHITSAISEGEAFYWAVGSKNYLELENVDFWGVRLNKFGNTACSEIPLFPTVVPHTFITGTGGSKGINDSVSIMQTPLPSSYLFEPNTKIICQTNASTAHTSALPIHIFPQPLYLPDNLIIKHVPPNSRWEILSAVGLPLLTGKVTTEDFIDIKIQSLTSGIYYLKIITESHNHITKLLFISN